MDIATKKVSEFIRSKGFNLSDMSRKTGIPYGALYGSLCNEARNRDLKADEFLIICDFLEKSPMDFAGKLDEEGRIAEKKSGKTKSQ